MEFLRRLVGPRQSAVEPAPAYLELRNMVLTIDPMAIGVTPTPELPNVVAAVLDWATGGGVATVVCVADGTTSLYTSGGGGTIGAGSHAPVAAAANRFLTAIERELDRFEPATEAPLPPQGHLALVVRTHDGLRRAEGASADLAAGRHPAAAAFSAAQDVISAIRDAGPG